MAAPSTSAVARVGTGKTAETPDLIPSDGLYQTEAWRFLTPRTTAPAFADRLQGGLVTATADRAGSHVPVEADFDRAPALLDGAMSLELTPQICNLEYWLGAVAQGTLRGLVKGGHRPTRPFPHGCGLPARCGRHC